SKNQMLNSILSGQTICICVTHVDGIVLAKTLFDTSANYRSAILFGKAQLLLDESERLEALKVITENIITGRWNEVPVGSQNQLKATMIIKFNIDRASAKVRAGGPEGDEAISTEIWSGHIPLSLKAAPPIPDSKFRTDLDITQSVRNFCQKNN
ncbi:MAG: pyridoxamine 5'-phosphate oxidase family protein, partial [Ferruginibacter sp.]